MTEMDKLVERVEYLSDVAFGDGHIHIEAEDNGHSTPLVILYDHVWVSPPEEGSPKYAWGTVKHSPGSYTSAPEWSYDDLGATDRMDDAIKEALRLVLDMVVDDALSREAEEYRYEDEVRRHEEMHERLEEKKGV